MVISNNIAISGDYHSRTESNSFRGMHLTLLTASSAVSKNITEEFREWITNRYRLSFRLLSRLYMNNCMYRILGCLSQIDRLHINRIQSSQSCILTLLEHIIKSQTFILFRLQHSISRYSRYTCANSYNRRCP